MPPTIASLSHPSQGDACGIGDEAVLAAFWERLLPHSGQVFRYWNPATNHTAYAGDLAGLLGLTAPPEPGLEAWVALLHPEDRQTFHQEVKASAAGAGLLEYEYRLWRPDGSFQMAREYSCSLGGTDQGAGLIALIGDIHSVRQAEHRLQHLQKMEAFSRLVGGVAHDFNNLLTIIGGYTEIMLEDGRAPESLRPFLGEVQVAANRASALTSQLLAFNQPQTGARVKSFDFNDLLRDAAKMLRRIMGPQVDLQIQPGSAPCVVKAMRARWEQAVIEMAVLVREGMPQGGTIRLTASEGEAPAGAGAELQGVAGVMLTVQGQPRTSTPDMPLPHLSTPFLESLEFIRQSGGTVLPSTEGTCIFLPGDSPKAAPAEPANEPPRKSGGETILLVEDDTTVRRLASGALTRLGYRVLEAQNGEDALALLRNSAAPRPHLLVTDVVLPGLGGKELATQAGQECPQMRVLLVSGYPNSSNKPLPGLEGRSGYLQKPFAPKALAAQIRALLDQPLPTRAA